MDKDTQKIVSDAEEIKNTIGTKGWSLVYAKLQEKILDLQNINNIDEDNVAVDLKARIMASKLLFEWAKNDVYGAIEQTATTLVPQAEPYIGRE